MDCNFDFTLAGGNVGVDAAMLKNVFEEGFVEQPTKGVVNVEGDADDLFRQGVKFGLGEDADGGMDGDGHGWERWQNDGGRMMAARARVQLIVRQIVVEGAVCLAFFQA